MSNGGFRFDRQIPNPDKVYPRPSDVNTCYLKNVISDPNIVVGDFTFYYGFTSSADFEQNNVLYHYPINNDKLIIGKFCSIASGARFIFNGANHTLNSFSTYPFPIFPEEWDNSLKANEAWDNKGDIVIGNDVLIGFEAVIMSGVHIGDGAIIGTRAVVTRDVPPYAIVGGVPAKMIRPRFDEPTVKMLLELKWWDWDIKKIMENLSAIRNMDMEVLQAAAKANFEKER